MAAFRVSQGEHWVRLYLIEAKTVEEAKCIYKHYVDTGEEGENLYMYDPEYLEDLPDDVVWFDKEGNILDG